MKHSRQIPYQYVGEVVFADNIHKSSKFAHFASKQLIVVLKSITITTTYEEHFEPGEDNSLTLSMIPTLSLSGKLDFYLDESCYSRQVPPLVSEILSTVPSEPLFDKSYSTLNRLVLDLLASHPDIAQFKIKEMIAS